MSGLNESTLIISTVYLFQSISSCAHTWLFYNQKAIYVKHKEQQILFQTVNGVNSNDFKSLIKNSFAGLPTTCPWGQQCLMAFAGQIVNCFSLRRSRMTSAPQHMRLCKLEKFKVKNNGSRKSKNLLEEQSLHSRVWKLNSGKIFFSALLSPYPRLSTYLHIEASDSCNFI